MVAMLTRIFGFHNLDLAEDVVQDAFCSALEVWKYSGVPDNPSAWLMATAKNRALDVLRRERTSRTFAPELGRLMSNERFVAPAFEDLFEPSALKDDLLRMMFSCCSPRLTDDAQIALILNILCSFSVGEVAGAFVCSHSAVEKRIQRGKKILAKSRALFNVVSPAEFSARLPSVHRALYLLFSEGYHGASKESAVRAELCRESMRLAALLLNSPLGTTTTYALSALMCLNAARLPSRVDASGNLTSLFDQDRSQWDQELIGEGLRLMELSATGTNVTEYHIQAAIAAVHATAPKAEETDWSTIVSLYDTLLEVRPSPIIALNRAIALAQRDGPERGLKEIEAISNIDRLFEYPFYFAALGELEFRRGRCDAAKAHFGVARALARNPQERRFSERRVFECDEPDRLTPQQIAS
jgi:RNA polymerase sigma-70 factor (ECF subfamily)